MDARVIPKGSAANFRGVVARSPRLSTRADAKIAASRLRTHAVDQIAFTAAITLAIWLGFYWAGRGLAQFAARGKPKAPQSPAPVYSIDLTSGEHELRVAHCVEPDLEIPLEGELADPVVLHLSRLRLCWVAPS
jgi:hypothetical protein